MVDLRYVPHSGPIDPAIERTTGDFEVLLARHFCREDGCGGPMPEDPLVLYVTNEFMRPPDSSNPDDPAFEVSISEVIDDFLSDNSVPEGFYLVDDEIPAVLAIADALEAQAKRIRDAVASAVVETREEYERSVSDGQ